MKRLTMVLGYCAALAACGGGGDDGGFGGTGGDQTAISAGNAVNVTAQAFSAIADTGVIGSFGRETARLLGLSVAGGAAIVAGVTPALITTRILLCDIGTLTYVWNDIDNNLVISAGDSFTLNFANCQFNDLQIVANGPAGLTVQQVFGEFASLQALYDFRGAYTFNKTDITYQGDKWVVQGDMTVRFSSNDGIQSLLNLVGSSLAVEQDGPSSQWQVMAYSLNQTDYADAAKYRFSAGQQTLDSTFIPGKVSFQTTTDFTGTEDTNPSAGQLRIDGNNKSSVLATAVINTTNVQLEVDADGDGARERTITVTWSEMGF